MGTGNLKNFILFLQLTLCCANWVGGLKLAKDNNKGLDSNNKLYGDDEEDEEEEYQETIDSQINQNSSTTLEKSPETEPEEEEEEKTFLQKTIGKVNMTGIIKRAFGLSLKAPEPVQNFLIGFMVMISSLEESINNRIDPPQVTLSPINEAIENLNPLDVPIHNGF